MGKRIAIITGASSGLGREFVLQLDGFTAGEHARIKRPEEIWVLARREENLRALAGLTTIPVRPLPCDLTDMESIRGLEALLQVERPEVVLLINAAGYGKIGPTAEMSLDHVCGMVDLNCRAAIGVTQVCLPYMEKGDRIIEICSTSAFQPLTMLNVYAASKAFLLHYSRALGAELRPRGITVTAVCPYWISDTEFVERAQLHHSNNEYIRSYPFADRRESVARLALLDASIGIGVSTPGILCTLHHLVCKILPTDLVLLAWEGIRRV